MVDPLPTMRSNELPEFPLSEGDRNAQVNDAIAYADRLSRAERIRDARNALAETWPVQMAKSIAGGLALPGDVAAGRVDPTSQIGIERALDLAGTVMGGGMSVGSAPRGSIGMFLGPSAKTADLQALDVARDMAQKGASREDVFGKTGWFQGADGKWRFEIPDTAASLRPDYATKATVGEAIEHPELFKAYPQLGGVEFNSTSIPKSNIQAMWSGSPDVPSTAPMLQVNKYAKDPTSSTMHELQHAVQAIEDFAPGGNTFVLKKGTPAWEIYQERLAAIKKPLPLETYAAVAGFGDDIEAARKSYPSYLKAVKNPSNLVIREAQKYAVESAYLRSAGEVEARNVQSRLKSGYEKRPWETQDFSEDMQIVRERERADGGIVDAALDVARRASGGRLLEDQYPTRYLPNVGRQVMQDGGMPNFEFLDADRVYTPEEEAIRNAPYITPTQKMDVMETYLGDVADQRLHRELPSQAATDPDVQSYLQSFAPTQTEARLERPAPDSLPPGEYGRQKLDRIMNNLFGSEILAALAAVRRAILSSPKRERADGGIVDEALDIVREEPTAQARRRATIAAIQPDAPEISPEERGRMFRQAVENYSRFPVRPGEATLSPYDQTPRERLGQMLAGDEGEQTPGGRLRSRLARAAVGTTGLEGSGIGFGVADLPMATGIPLLAADVAGSASRGNYGEAALGAALPAAFYARRPLMEAGRRAVDVARDVVGRVPAPVAAGAAGAAVMTPEEAEAAGKSKMVQQVLDLVRTADRPASSRFVSQAGEYGYFNPQTARQRDPRLYHPIYENKLSRPLGEMSFERRITEPVAERKFIEPAALERSALVPALGDPTAGGGQLVGVNEVKLKAPVEMQAGHSFMFGPSATGPDKAVWASDPGIISALAGKARAAAEAGYDPYLSYVKMGARSGDYSHHMADTLRGLLPASKASRETVAEFDRQMRENVANKWAAYSDWPGLKSKSLEEYLYRTGPGKARTKMAELMAQGRFQKEGMPDVGAARFAITDPALLHAEDYSAGHTIAKLDPTGRVIKEPAVPHKTYKHQLGGDPDVGYVGGFEYDVPFNVMNKEFIDKLMATDPEKYANPSQLAYTYRMHQPTVFMTPEVVDRISTFLDLKKRGLVP